ncbi:hypothetical protein FF38_03061, partial [Lucilia cuprina]
EDIKEPQLATILPQRVFLYLHPKSITYPSDDIPLNGRLEIEIEHPYNTITTLSDHFTARNVIQVDKFENEKPTFSITIEQDSLQDITNLSDTPIILTLYVYTKRLSNTSKLTEENVSEEEGGYESGERIPIAQGFIDIMEHFNKNRSHGFDTIYLYPLKTYAETLTWKTVWEIYSLHSLLKNVEFTNVLFINFGSLYNIDEELMQDCNDLVANISFISKIPNENNIFDKIFICKFSTFYKDIISLQNLSKKWESLKNKEIENSNSMGIATDSKFHLHHLFTNLLCTENAQLNIAEINITKDFALICNSIHRYILTDIMQKTLEEILSQNQYQIIVEIYKEREENIVLLEGYIDLSVFMYPEVRIVPFAIELKPPNFQATNKDTMKNTKEKRKSQNKFNAQELTNKKIPFAIIQFCLNSPITNPLQVISRATGHKSKRHKYSHCTTTILTKTIQKDLSVKCEENYRDFDDLIREILDYMIIHEIKTLNDDNEYFCHQLGNLANKIMKLVACDFNIKTPTKTNIEFTNLLTMVYRELITRINNYLNICYFNNLEDCLLKMNAIETALVTNMSMVKYLYESEGNIEIAEFIMNKLRSEHANNLILDFYTFLYDIERQNFDLVKLYLDKPLDEKDNQAEIFGELIEIYVNYKLQLQQPEESSNAEEFLIKSLIKHNINHNPKSLTGWILLYCVYKKYNYEPGMTYCRWKYENLYKRSFVKLDIIPKSRWEIYMPYKIKLKSIKGQNYIKVFEILLRLGLYNFSEWIFTEIAEECMEIERYFVTSTFMILNKNLEKFQIKTFPLDKLINSLQMSAVLALVNGNLEYLRETNSPAAINQYHKLTEFEDMHDFKLCQLGLWRYAYSMMKEQKYEEAKNIFRNFCKENVNCLVAAIEYGKACYYLGQLDESAKYFALSTQYGIYMPNTWAYLALINLKCGNNYNALECWKYARLNPNTEICEEVVKELNKINMNEICLYQKQIKTKMVSKKNFQQNGRVNQQQRQMPYKKPPLKPPMMQNFNNPMFNVSQIPDNPGYLDFNLPTPPTLSNNATGNGSAANNKNANGNANTAGTGAGQNNKKKNNKNKQRNKPQAQQQIAQQNGGGNWKNKNQQGGGPMNQRFNGGGAGRNFQPMGNRRSSRLMGPMGGPRGMGIMGPQIPPPMGFQPPMIPPMPPMGRGGPPLPPMVAPVPPPFMRRGNGPMPPPMPPMLPPRMARGMPPVPFNAPIAGPGKINKKGKVNKKVTKGKSTIKTLKNLINQYPLDKPWVNDEIRGEHEKKVDIENRLKGNKDDELFAQFKVQRDKFVAMYEAAREEYLKKEAAAVKAKDEKDKQTNNNTTKKDDKKEAKTNDTKTKTV